jgi:hypothetical protein
MYELPQARKDVSDLERHVQVICSKRRADSMDLHIKPSALINCKELRL